MFSCSHQVGYAIRALACLEGGRCSTRYVRDVAKCAQVPPAYLAKIFRRLAQADIVKGTRGPNGGTRLARPVQEISLLEIARTLEPGKPRPACLLGLAKCQDEQTCPARGLCQDIFLRNERELAGKTLADVIEFKRRPAIDTGRRKKTKHSCSL